MIHDYASVTFGSDPEFFFANEKGEVIGSEKVLKKGGKEISSNKFSSSSLTPVGSYSAFILDGVQVEMNTNAHACRQAMAIEIAFAFKSLRTYLNDKAKNGEKISACFANTIQVDKKEFDSLSDKSKEFGCAPSFNLYNSGAQVGVDPSIYRKRSAGGHIHLGLSKGSKLYEHRERLIPILDCLVGLTSVLVDRDEGNKERRKVYGRAGEYRLPDHGIEYRTLSNFWLRSYPLMGMVLGLSRLAVQVLNNTLVAHNNDLEKDLLDRVDLEKVIQAINTNDLVLAQEQWQGVKAFIQTHSATSHGSWLSGPLLPQFEYFVEQIHKKGLDYWFPEDPLIYWSTIADNNDVGAGFEAFLEQGRVNQEYQKQRVGG